MIQTQSAVDWRDEFVLARDFRSSGRNADLAEMIRDATVVRVSRGAYRFAAAIPKDPTLLREDALLARVRAANLVWGGHLVFAGFAAAAVWRLPLFGHAPEKLEVASAPEAGGRSNAELRRSYVPDVTAAIEIDGIRVTPLARTVVDVGRWGTFTQAVVVADAAMHGDEARRPALELGELLDVGERLGRLPGARKCRSVLGFADAGSASPGESASRVTIARLGFPAPVLQREFRDGRGLIGYVDFWWPESNVIGEFDGLGKYLRDEFTRGQDAGTLVLAEKERENRLRATGATVGRWDWPVALSPARLRETLHTAGLRETGYDRAEVHRPRGGAYARAGGDPQRGGRFR